MSLQEAPPTGGYLHNLVIERRARLARLGVGVSRPARNDEALAALSSAGSVRPRSTPCLSSYGGCITATWLVIPDFSVSPTRPATAKRTPYQKRNKTIESAASRILETVCRAHAVSPAAVLSDYRGRRVARVRQEVSYRLRTELAMSYLAIASFMHRADHTSIMFQVGEFAQRMEKAACQSSSV